MLETLGHFKVELLNRLISAGYLLLFPVVYLAPQLSHKIIALALASLGSLVAWLAALRRYHLIADTPTSRIASAAQGYVELEGRCEPHPGSAPLGFLSGPPCVCYRYVTHRLSGCEWQFIDHGQSSETFLLLDESGTCVIDPEQAEVLTTHRHKWVSGYYKQQVEYLAPGDMIYALGELAIPFDRHSSFWIGQTAHPASSLLLVLRGCAHGSNRAQTPILSVVFTLPNYFFFRIAVSIPPVFW